MGGKVLRISSKHTRRSRPGSSTKGWGNTNRPNFFIAIQVDDNNIIAQVENLQKLLTQGKNAVFQHTLTYTNRLHFTLHTMYLGEDDIKKAQEALGECGNEVKREYSGPQDWPMNLPIEGIGHFGNKVLFAEVKEEKYRESLARISQIFRERLKAAGIPVDDTKPFHPHLTLAKISKFDKFNQQKFPSFPPEMWSAYQDIQFGVQKVASLQLLKIGGSDPQTGYYNSYGQFYF